MTRFSNVSQQYDIIYTRQSIDTTQLLRHRLQHAKLWMVKSGVVIERSCVSCRVFQYYASRKRLTGLSCIQINYHAYTQESNKTFACVLWVCYGNVKANLSVHAFICCLMDLKWFQPSLLWHVKCFPPFLTLPY